MTRKDVNEWVQLGDGVCMEPLYREVHDGEGIEIMEDPSVSTRKYPLIITYEELDRIDYVAAKNERIKRLEEALRDVEWRPDGVDEDCCAWCGGRFPRHYEDCLRQAALKED